MADNIDSCSIKKVRGKSSRYPSTVDGISGPDNISSLFREKYNKLDDNA